ncbi:MAG: hypothetical protein ACYTAF_05110 [Planctomycetota bacterium]|jgi:hypothetical protein
MRRNDIGVIVGALLFALLAAYALARDVPSDADAWAAKQALMEEDFFFRLHNLVYEKVGKERWNGIVRPTIMSELTLHTIKDTGNPFPDYPDILQWVRENPEQTEGILERFLEE